MIPVCLTTDRVKLEDGSTAYPFMWNDQIIPINDNALSAVEIFALFRDQEVNENDKAIRIIELMFVDPEAAYAACLFDAPEFGALINAVTKDVFGIEDQGGTTPVPLWDIEEDAAFIRASLRMAYGIEWDAVRNHISWAEFVYLIAALPYETPLGMRIYYRNIDNKPKPTKHNREQREEFMRLHRLFEIKDSKSGSHDSAERASEVMDDFSLALRSMHK